MSKISFEKLKVREHHAVCICDNWWHTSLDRLAVMKDVKSHLKENPKHRISVSTTNTTYYFIKP